MPRIIRFKPKRQSKSEFRRNYTEYLKSEEWRIKREQAFMFHGRKCKKCGSNKTLHVHHMTYIRLKNEIMEDFCILCNLCHIEYHKLNKTVSIESTEAFLTLKGTIQPIKKAKKINNTTEERFRRLSEYDKVNMAISRRRRAKVLNKKVHEEWLKIHNHESNPIRRDTGLLSMKDILKRQDELEREGKL